MSLPLELITMAVSTLMGIWSKNMDAKNAFTLKAMTQQQEGYEDARNATGEGIAWTRRFIVVAATLSIIVLPKLAALYFPELLVTTGYMEFIPGFLFLSGHDAIIWKTFTGFVITPLDTHLMSAIAGFYLGQGRSR